MNLLSDPAILMLQGVQQDRTASWGFAADGVCLLLQQYLSDKQRSGVVELGPAGGGGAPRTLYIVPPSRTVCDELHIAWDSEVTAFPERSQ
jgi:SPOC domain